MLLVALSLILTLFPPGTGAAAGDVPDETEPASGRASSAPVWPMQGFNAQHTGRCPYSTSDNPGQLKWQFKASDGFFGGPVIGADGTIFIGDLGGRFYGIAPNGTLKWTFKAAGRVMDCAALDSNGNIYFGTEYGVVHSLDPSGKQRWNFTLSAILHSSVIVGSDDTIYFGTFHGNLPDYLYALRPNGTVRWYSKLGAEVRDSTPAIGPDGTIYIGCVDNYTYAINPNGTPKWKFDCGDRVESTPMVGPDGTIYISAAGFLYALRPNGTVIWKSGIAGSLSLGADGTIYVSSWGSNFTAIAPNGTEKWRCHIEGQVSAAAISAEGRIYVGTGELLALDGNGRKLWGCDVGGVIDPGPAIGPDGTVYVAAGNDRVVAVGVPPPPSLRAPSPPRYLRNDNSVGHVDLSWDPPLSDGNSTIIAYSVYRGNSSQNMQLLGLASSGAEEYTDGSVQSGHTYYYLVTASNSIGESGNSSTIPVMVTAAPQPPANNTQPGRDTTPPVLTITYPANGTVIRDTEVTVRGYVSDNVGVSRVYVNNSLSSWMAHRSGSSWSASVQLRSGTNTINVTASDLSGNVANISVTVRREDPPEPVGLPTWAPPALAVSFAAAALLVGYYIFKPQRPRMPS